MISHDKSNVRKMHMEFSLALAFTWHKKVMSTRPILPWMWTLDMTSHKAWPSWWACCFEDTIKGPYLCLCFLLKKRIKTNLETHGNVICRCLSQVYDYLMALPKTKSKHPLQHGRGLLPWHRINATKRLGGCPERSGLGGHCHSHSSHSSHRAPEAIDEAMCEMVPSFLKLLQSPLTVLSLGQETWDLWPGQLLPMTSWTCRQTIKH